MKIHGIGQSLQFICLALLSIESSGGSSIWRKGVRVIIIWRKGVRVIIIWRKGGTCYNYLEKGGTCYNYLEKGGYAL